MTKRFDEYVDFANSYYSNVMGLLSENRKALEPSLVDKSGGQQFKTYQSWIYLLVDVLFGLISFLLYHTVNGDFSKLLNA